MRGGFGATCCALLWALAASGLAQGTAPDAGPSDASVAAQDPAQDPAQEQALPPEHRPKLSLSLAPDTGLHTGDVLRVSLAAEALAGDTVTVSDQSFAPFEIVDKQARSEPAAEGKTRFVFELELIALEPGEQRLPSIELRVVTADGVIGSVHSEAVDVRVKSVLGNEPNAEPKPPSEPVVVMQDDYILLYILYGVLGAALVALLTWLALRYWQRREKPVPPPPPPRPPWEIAVEKLADLRRRKAQMVEQGQGVEFVDEASDVVREYLGGRFGFDGLETTTDEMLALLRRNNANLGLLQEVGAYLKRCDLVKFAKVVPDGDEVDLIFAKAQDIVQFSTPHPAANVAGREGERVAADPAAPDRRVQR